VREFIMPGLKPDLYEQLFEISQGRLDLFREATDAFVQTAESTTIGETAAPDNNSGKTLGRL
jgi:hypothetical protein